jgi:predicted transcriptional regulator
MPTAKEEIRRLIETLPDDATWEDVQYSIYVRERIERGRREAAEGKVLEQDEVERRMKPWLKE